MVIDSGIRYGLRHGNRYCHPYGNPSVYSQNILAKLHLSCHHLPLITRKKNCPSQQKIPTLLPTSDSNFFCGSAVESSSISFVHENFNTQRPPSRATATSVPTISWFDFKCIREKKTPKGI